MRRGIGRLRAGGNSGPPTANMVAWFRKGIGQTDAGAGALSAWADQSGNGRNYSQGTGANRPVIQADGTVLFNGTAHFLKTASFTLNQPFTRYLRLKQVTWTANDYIFDGNTQDSGSVYQGPTVTPQISLYAGTTAATNTNLAVNTWGSIAAVFNGASSSLKVDSNAATTGNPLTNNPGGLTLGAGATPTGYSNIQVAEEIVYNVAHDAATQAAVIAYLNSVGP